MCVCVCVCMWGGGGGKGGTLGNVGPHPLEIVTGFPNNLALVCLVGMYVHVAVEVDY